MRLLNTIGKSIDYGIDPGCHILTVVQLVFLSPKSQECSAYSLFKLLLLTFNARTVSFYFRKDFLFLFCVKTFFFLPNQHHMILPFRNYFFMVKKYGFTKSDGHSQNFVVCKEPLVIPLSTV